MNILHVSETTTAYMPARFVDLINKYTGHQANLIQFRDFFIGNPLNIQPIREAHAIVQAFEWADVLHFHSTRPIQTGKVHGVKIGKYLTKKKLFHFHGSPYRERYKSHRNYLPLIYSTPEMAPLFPSGQFFPNLIDETDTKLYSSKISKPLINGDSRSRRSLRICHHFSLHRHLKNTEEFYALQHKYMYNGNADKITLGFIGKKDLAAAIKERAQYDVVFDHLQGYYGLVSIEAMAQGIAVINGITSETMNHLHRFLGAVPPFIVASDSSLGWIIESLCHESANEYGILGRQFMVEHWSGKKNIGRLIDIYEGL